MLVKAIVARMTVRDIRQRWPEAEKQLATDGEIIVTRDSRPVARIVPYVEPARARRRRFRAAGHLAWLRRVWKGRPRGPSTDDLLQTDRSE